MRFKYAIRIVMIRRLLTCVLTGILLTAPLAMGSLYQPSDNYACREFAVEGASVDEVQGVFEQLFGSSMQQTREQWNAERRVYYFAFPLRATDGKRVLHECVWLLSEDGNKLRYLTCEKLADGTRRAFHERVQLAVRPYLFVKFEEDAAYFSLWNPVPDSRNMIHVEQIRVDYKTCTYPLTRRMTEDEKAMVVRYARPITQPEQWDAENKVLYRSRYHDYMAVPYAAAGVHIFSPDERHCRYISVKMNEQGECINGSVWESVLVAPGVYMTAIRPEKSVNPNYVQIEIFEKNPQTGALTYKETRCYYVPTQHVLSPY